MQYHRGCSTKAAKASHPTTPSACTQVLYNLTAFMYMLWSGANHLAAGLLQGQLLLHGLLQDRGLMLVPRKPLVSHVDVKGCTATGRACV